MEDENCTTDKLMLSTYSPRVRHLRSLCLRNLSYECADVNQLSTFFTLHKLPTSPAFYKSDILNATLNPAWKAFDLTFLPCVYTSTNLVCLRIWVSDGDGPPRVHIEHDIDLTILTATNQTEPASSPDSSEKSLQDVLTLSMFDSNYELPVASSPICQPAECLYLRTNLHVKQSYSRNLLARLQVVLRALKQTEQSVDRVRQDIERRLIEIQNITDKKESMELYKVTMESMRLRVDKTKQTMMNKRSKLYSRRSETNKKEKELELYQKAMQDEDSQFTDLRSDHINNREKILKANALLTKRHKQMVYELSVIYPIDQTVDGRYTIAGVYLPNPETVSSQNELANSTALGHCVHLIQMLSRFLNIPLEYPMEYRGSRSQIFDMVRPANQVASALQKDRSVPLYTKGKDKRLFQYGVYLLNKNIEQLRYSSGLNTKDRKLTLRNLKDFLQNKFDVGNTTRSGEVLTITSPPPLPYGVHRTNSVPYIRSSQPFSQLERQNSVAAFGHDRYSNPTEMPSAEESGEEAPAHHVRLVSAINEVPADSQEPVSGTPSSDDMAEKHSSEITKLNGDTHNHVGNNTSDQSDTGTKSKSGSASSASASEPFDTDLSKVIEQKLTIENAINDKTAEDNS